MDALSDPLTEEPTLSRDLGGSIPETRELSKEQWRNLFVKLAAGDARAFERLYDLMARRLYGFALWRSASEQDASDIVHDTFVRIAEQGERLLRVRDPKSWIFTVANRLLLDRVRWRLRWRSESLDGLKLVEASESEAGRVVDAQKAQQALVRLSAAQREVVYLRHFGEFTFAEIGSILGVSTFTVASRYRLGIRKLRRLMEVSK
ncbi:MAG: RNA polymerase sigma factor [bacterium]|nr:RNA polymerase sigma factor [bacterium]